MRLNVYKFCAVVSVMLCACVPAGLVDAAKPKPIHHKSPNLTRHLDMVFVTLVKVRTGKQIGDYVPQEGYLYLTVYLRAVNRNDVQKQASDSDFTVVTPNGNSISEEATTLFPAFKQTVLDPAGTTYGCISYQVPLAGHHIMLRWQPIPDHSDENWPTVTWPITY